MERVASVESSSHARRGSQENRSIVRTPNRSDNAGLAKTDRLALAPEQRDDSDFQSARDYQSVSPEKSDEIKSRERKENLRDNAATKIQAFERSRRAKKTARALTAIEDERIAKKIDEDSERSNSPALTSQERAASEKQRQKTKISAATKIQALARNRRAKKTAKDLKIDNKTRAIDEARRRSAIKLQTFARRRSALKTAKDLTIGEVKHEDSDSFKSAVSRSQESAASEKELKKTRSSAAATKIQALQRTRTASKTFRNEKMRAIKLQALARKRSAMSKTRALRAKIAKEKDDRRDKRREGPLPNSRETKKRKTYKSPTFTIGQPPLQDKRKPKQGRNQSKKNSDSKPAVRFSKRLAKQKRGY